MFDEVADLYDPETGLVGRALFLDRLTHGRERASRADSLMGLILTEIDRFESVPNEQSSALVLASARRVRSCTRRVDTAARLELARFGVIIEGARGRDHITEVANKLVHQFSQPFVLDDTRLEVTASVGVAIHPWDSDDVEQLFWQAESAMNKAQDLGGNSYRLYDESHLSE